MNDLNFDKSPQKEKPPTKIKKDPLDIKSQNPHFLPQHPAIYT